MKRRDFLMWSSSVAGAFVPLLSRAVPCPPPSVSARNGTSATTPCAAPTDLEADWQARISGPGVVWYHDFRLDTEVDNFRWTPGYGSGNDPKAVGSSNAKYVRRIANDGIGGTGCLEIYRTAGTNDGSHWWRPFSPIVGGTTSGNGRGSGQNDPGANGSITARSYSPTDGGGQISGWDGGFYGNAAYQTQEPSAFDGTEYWLQVRVKMDPNRITGGNEDTTVGKLFYFTRTDRSLTSQEIVTYSGNPVNGQNYFSMYRSGSPPLNTDSPGTATRGDQPGTQFGTVGDKTCRYDNSGGRLANCWHWPAGQWATIMWHIKPGKNANGQFPGTGSSDPVGNHDTLIEVWVAAPGAKQFTKIWYQPDADVPWDVMGGHNAVICSIYQNGSNMPQAFYHRYDQIIFSKASIPCPQV
jgi:hypothetical protein